MGSILSTDLELPTGWEWTRAFPVLIEYDNDEKDWYVTDHFLYRSAIGYTREEALDRYVRDVMKMAQEITEGWYMRRDMSVERSAFESCVRYVGDR